MKKQKKYLCITHKSNNGYIDSTGTWKCWKCTREDEYLYPRGKVIEKFTIGDYEVRILSIGSHNVIVEKWNTKKKKRLVNEIHNYLSTAIRKYQRIVDEVDRGLYLERDEGETSREEDIPSLDPDLYRAYVLNSEGLSTTSNNPPSPERPIEEELREINPSRIVDLGDIQEYDTIYFCRYFSSSNSIPNHSIFIDCLFREEILEYLPDYHLLFRACTIVNENGSLRSFVPDTPNINRIYSLLELTKQICLDEEVDSITVERLIEEIGNRE
uniref:Uncharacterized protein n=1 Tax=viral metagenome TaxID=1070528 RepID=A0A6M3XI64_9ZZZZ